MRILFVTPYLATPPRFGAQRRLDGLMRSLAARHDVTLVTFADPREDVAAAVRAAETYCSRVIAVPNRTYALTSAGKRLLQLRSLLSRRSYESFVHHDPSLTRALREALGATRYDIVNFEFSHMATPDRARMSSGSDRPILVLDEHNIEYDLVRRTAATARRPPRKLYSEVNWRKLRREEHAAWRLFDGCTVTSARDEELLRRDYPRARTAVVPNGVDVDYFRPKMDGPTDPMTLVFFGAISYHPNTDGLLYFLRAIFPILRLRYPGIQLRIVGPSVPRQIASCAGDGVIVTGLVDDLRAELERATAIVVPLRIGGGTRLKILEGMAMRKAIVSTTIGAEGIDIQHGREILLADEPADFAREVGRLIDDAALRDRIGLAARALVERRYSWDLSAARLEAFYAELLARRTALAA